MKTEENKKIRLTVKLVEKEKTEVEHSSTGQKSLAMKLLYKGMVKGKDVLYLPILINHLVENNGKDNDDENILKQTKQKARETFLKAFS